MIGQYITALISTIVVILIMAALLYIRGYGKSAPCKAGASEGLSRKASHNETHAKEHD